MLSDNRDNTNIIVLISSQHHQNGKTEGGKTSNSFSNKKRKQSILQKHGAGR